MNIQDHFENLKKAHLERVAVANVELMKLKTEYARKSEEKDSLESEKNTKQNLLVQTEAAGVDGTQLKGLIQDLNLRIARCAEALESLKTCAAEHATVVSRRFDKEDRMVSVLNEAYQIKEASAMDNLEEIFRTLPVRITQINKTGRPTQCMVSLGKTDIVINIKHGEKHFLKKFLPEPLRWIPAIVGSEATATQQNGEQKKEFTVFFDRQKLMLVLMDTRLNWQTEIHPANRSHFNGRTHQVHEEDFADMAISLVATVEELLAKENHEVCLDNEYADNPLLAHVRTEIEAQTSPTPRFKECKEQLSSSEIHKRIKDDWDAFVNSPWSSQINETFALLKYHAENGERVRFWSESHEGHHGFRLRTCDHSWIVGEIYISKEANGGRLKMVQDGYNHRIASIGKMYFFAKLEKDRH